MEAYKNLVYYPEAVKDYRELSESTVISDDGKYRFLIVRSENGNYMAVVEASFQYKPTPDWSIQVGSIDLFTQDLDKATTLTRTIRNNSSNSILQLVELFSGAWGEDLPF